MSEQENLEIVRRGYKAFSEGDMRTLRNLLAEDVEWHFPPTYAGIPWAQHPWRGWDGYLQANKLLSQFLEFQLYQPDEFIAGGDSVVVLGPNDADSRQAAALSKPVGSKYSRCAMAKSASLANIAILPHGTTDTAARPGGNSPQAKITANRHPAYTRRILLLGARAQPPRFY